jgi:polynucleotide 5'-kinase involved in rRNA processing
MERSEETSKIKGTKKEAKKPASGLAKKLKQLYGAQDMLPKLIEDESIPEQKMDDYYAKLQILLDSNQEKEPIELNKIFDKVKDHDATGKVLIVGGPGIGKTTLLISSIDKDFFGLVRKFFNLSIPLLIGTSIT